MLIDFPHVVKTKLSSGKLYCIDEAYTVLRSDNMCSSYDLRLAVCSKSSTYAKHEIKLELCKLLDDDSPVCALYTAVPYTVLLCKTVSGKLAIVDTQGLMGNWNGDYTVAIFTTVQSQTAISALMNWLFSRMDVSMCVQHELTVMNPTINVQSHKQTMLHVHECSSKNSQYLGVTDHRIVTSDSNVQDNQLPERSDISVVLDCTNHSADSYQSLVRSDSNVQDNPLQNRSDPVVAQDCTSLSCASDDEIQSSHCSSQIESSIEMSYDSVSRKRKSYRWRESEFSIIHWQLCTAEVVDKLPEDINGLRKFIINCNNANDDMMKITKDGRPWKTWVTSSRKGFHGIRRVARCGGNFTCTSPSCPYLAEHGKPNRLHFNRKADGRFCFTCAAPAQHVLCPAIKVWERDNTLQQIAVYHRGDHTCCIRRRYCLSDKNTLLKAIRENPSLPPGKLVNSEMVNMMTSDDFKWDDIMTVADSFADLKHVQYLRQLTKHQENPCGENFEALGLLKSKCYEKDEYLIYKINNRSLNGSPSYVFKSSTSMAYLAIDMDRDGNGVLNKEFAFVDAKHDRCRGFKSVTLWTYHPTMRKLLRLAVMEVEHENAENLTVFWQIFNEMLQKVSSKISYKFNPTGFVADEHHANWISISNVFGKDVITRVVSCEFHFKQSVQRHAKFLHSQSQEFKLLADNMLTAESISEFNAASDAMQCFVEHNDAVEDWFKWWHKRRTHIF